MTKIETDRRSQRGKLQRQVRRSATQIERDRVRAPQPIGNFFDDEPPPASVDVERQRVVEKIVTRRDLGKHRAHLGGLCVAAQVGCLNLHQRLPGEDYLSTATAPTFFITLSNRLAGPAITMVTDCGRK